MSPTQPVGPRRPAAVLCDLDGTLIDSLPDLWAATNAMRQELGRAPLSPDQVARAVGEGIPALVARTLQIGAGSVADEALLAQALARFLHHYRSTNGQRAQLYDGVAEGLAALHAQGLKLALVTNKATEFVGPLLRRTGLDEWFPVRVCGDTCARRKPDPMPLLHACTRLGVAAPAALFVGDSVHDVRAAHAAGMPVVVLSHGYSGGMPVQQLTADAIVNSFAEAVRWAVAFGEQPQPPSTE